MPPRLLIPGPVELEPDVLAVLAQPIQAHYGDAWVEVHNETIQLLQAAYETSGRVYMLPGSGSLAVDTATHSTFLPGDTVIAGNNGWFGERLVDILRSNGVNVVVVASEPRQALDPDAFAQALKNHPEAAGVAAVHLETSTGVLNPIEAIARTVHAQSDALLLVDAVTGLAGADLQTDAWGIDLCVSASQKALGAPPGLGIVAVSNRALARISARPEDTPRSWYLDLKRWQWYVENWGDWHPFPVTMPTPIVLALRAALRSLLREGVATRRARYQKMADHLRGALEEMGMPLFVPASMMAPTITAAFVPEGVGSPAIRDYLLREYNLQITTGFGPYKEQVIRIGHMGGAVTDDDIAQLVTGLRAFVAQHALKA
ncbi:MAG: alanine--glyoxylate aminotransferase family protein [Chloroflexi bacterium]|nr:alanine--glyoxylate aminotransferase family protein [Chloroflexota bacterium]